MPPHPTYSLSLEPIYEPSPEAPETLVGQVLVLEEPARRTVCRVEVRAAWTPAGEIAVGTPDPPSLPGLGEEEIQKRARALVALLRDEKLSGQQTAGGDPSAP